MPGVKVPPCLTLCAERVAGWNHHENWNRFSLLVSCAGSSVIHSAVVVSHLGTPFRKKLLVDSLSRSSLDDHTICRTHLVWFETPLANKGPHPGLSQPYEAGCSAPNETNPTLYGVTAVSPSKTERLSSLNSDDSWRSTGTRPCLWRSRDFAFLSRHLDPSSHSAYVRPKPT